MRTVLMGIGMVLVTGIVGAAEGSITPGYMTSWEIVCNSAATQSEQYAATEFQLLFKEMTGTELAIVSTASGSTGAVFIGPDAVTASGRKPRFEQLGEEGLHITVSKKAVRISGGRPRGTLYGVYEFFEELCGVRYLTRDHTYYPENAAALQIPLGKKIHIPTFAFRWSYYGETNRHPEFAARLHTNTVGGEAKLGGITGYKLVSHNVAYLVPPKKYGAEHPEYYALVNGKRILDMHGGGPQLCMTNPEVLDVVVAAVRAEIKAKPGVRNINIAHMDNTSYCTCENCAAIDAREESHAGATLSLVNAVAEEIEKTNPEILLSTYAYQYTRKPPKTIRARHNVLIQLCSIECCTYHAIDDPTCATNREFCDDTAGWQKKADNIFIWHYNTNFRGYLLPFPNLRAMGKSVAYFEKNNGRGVFMQAAGNGYSTELSDLRNYVMSRCLWKPGRSSWEEAQEFIRLHYQESAQPILDYITYYHDLVDDGDLHPGCFPTEASLAISPESSQRITAYFQEALALAKSDAVRARVEKASLCALRAALSTTSMKLVYKDGVCKPDLDGSQADLVEEYAKLVERYGVPMDGEHATAQTYINEMRTLHAGMKAVKIENETWRLVLLPDSNAKIVEMTYKPTGRNVIQPARALDRFRFEEWVRQGAGPTSPNIRAYEVKAQEDKAVLSVTAKDGARIERTITLDGETIRFETVMTAKDARAFDFMVHPEYDAGTGSEDPEEIAIYVKGSDWVHANQGWQEAKPSEGQSAIIQDNIAGGVFAYYNHAENFGVEQRFDPKEFGTISLYWSPARRQINLEMTTEIQELEAGQQARYAYEVHYLKEAPMK
jgi:hypothetical protein